MTVKKEQIEERLTYTLKKPFTHEGNVYKQADIDAGVTITITEEDAQALKEQGVIDQPEED